MRLFREFKEPRKLCLRFLKSKRDQERYGRRLNMLENSKKGKVDVIRDKLKKANFN